MTEFEKFLVVFGTLLVIISIANIATKKQTLHEPCKNTYMCPIKR